MTKSIPNNFHAIQEMLSIYTIFLRDLGAHAGNSSSWDTRFSGDEANEYQRAILSFLERARGSFDQDGVGDGRLSPQQSLFLLMAEAHLAWFECGARYFQGAAEAAACHGISIADIMQSKIDDDASPEHRNRALLDEMRGYLRTLGDLSVTGAHALHENLTMIESAMRATLAEESTGDASRYWRAKP